MRKKSLAAIALFLLLFSSFSSKSYAEIKAGSKCTKAGSKFISSSRTFTCIKSGQKLVWNKGIPIKKKTKLSSPSPSASSSASPLQSDVLTVAERWNAIDSSALSDAQKLMLSKRSDSHTVNLIYKGSDKSNIEVMDEIKRRYSLVAKFWEPYVIVKNPLLVVVGNIGEIDWICREKLAWLPKYNQPNCVEVEGKGDWSNGTAGQSQTLTHNIDMYTIDNLKRLNTVGYLARIEHEFTHSIFHALNVDYNRTMPCWMIESGAEYWGVLTASVQNFSKFIQLRNYQSQRQNFAMKGAPESTWYDYLIRTDRTDLYRPLNEDSCGAVRNEIYSHAFLANEYLVSKVGLDGYIELIKLAQTVGWSKAVENKFAKSRDEVYRDMAKYMKYQFDLILENPWSFGQLL